MNEPRIGRPRKYPLSDEEYAVLSAKRKARLEYRKMQRDKPIVKYYNKHNLSYSHRPDLKALVLAWIQPVGEEEIVQSILVERNQVDNVTVQTLLQEYHKNKKGTKVET